MLSYENLKSNVVMLDSLLQFGSEALAYMTTGQGNDAFGYTAGKSISTGGTNVVFGSFSMDSGGAQTGSGNTHIGHAGARSLTSGYNNASLGLSQLVAIIHVLVMRQDKQISQVEQLQLQVIKLL